MFQVHPQLVKDTLPVVRFALSRLLLHRNAGVTWFILVPETEAVEIFEMPESQSLQLRREIDFVSAFVKKELGAAKINVAAIGNMVPQMHIHVVGRSPGDPAWPGVVWGADLGDSVWGEDEVLLLASRLREHAPEGILAAT